VTAAAGNYPGENSCHYSPASTPEAVAIGATSIDDFISTFSISGSCVDLFAPGNIYF
jgi:subtilisin family serine protease